MSHDDHDDELPVSPAERARAEAFGLLIDDLLQGEPLPPAMDPDERDLALAAAQVIASTHVAELDTGRRRRVIDQALEAAMLGPREPAAGASATFSARRRRAERVMRVVPWAVASVAAAAAVILLVTRPADLTGELEARSRASRALPVEQTSRPSDPLVGEIPRGELGAASGRLDAIFADRMAGYRALTLAGGGRR